MRAGPHVDRVHAAGAGRPSIVSHIRAARAAAATVDFDAKSFQIFAAGPRKMEITLRDEEADELRAYLEGEPQLTVISHGTYADFPWNGKPYPPKFIRSELEMCARAGIAGLVVHLGKPPPDVVMAVIPKLVIAAPGVKVYLEIPHVKPENSHYETPEKLAVLFREIRKLDPTLCKFGLCIDTAHLWSCGVDIQSYEDAEDWLERLAAVGDVITPADIIIHLNDSMDECGSGVDRHAPLLGGKMWEDYADRPKQSGLAAFVDYAARHEIVTILERKPPSALLDDYAVLERLTDTVRLDH